MFHLWKVEDCLSAMLFRAPLSLAGVLSYVFLGEQALSAGIASVTKHNEQSKRTQDWIAGFGIAYSLGYLLVGLLSECQHWATAGLISSLKRYNIALLFVLCGGLLLGGLLFCMGSTNLGTLFIDKLHATSKEEGAVARFTLKVLCLFPVLECMSSFHAGLLLRQQKAAIVSGITLSSFVIQVVSVIMLSHITPLTTLEKGSSSQSTHVVVLVPVVSLYAGVTSRSLGITASAYYWVIPRRSKQYAPLQESHAVVQDIAEHSWQEAASAINNEPAARSGYHDLTFPNEFPGTSLFLTGKKCTCSHWKL